MTLGAGNNLILNGDFVDGAWMAPQWWGTSAPQGSVDHWVLEGDSSNPPQNGINFEKQSNNFEGLSSSTDGGMIDLGASPGNYQLSQTVAGLSAGSTYAIQFEVGAPFPGTALLEVIWGGQVIAVIDTSRHEGELDVYSYVVTASARSGAEQADVPRNRRGFRAAPGQQPA